jgi:hypothetical protein
MVVRGRVGPRGIRASYFSLLAGRRGLRLNVQIPRSEAFFSCLDATN